MATSSNLKTQWRQIRIWTYHITIPILISFPAIGGDTNFRNVIFGERAFGLGGAYSAISNDSSGCFYNPAGMAYIPQSSFSVSASIYSINENTTEDAFIHLGFQGEDATSSELLTIPSTVASSWIIKDWLTVGICAAVNDFRKIAIDSQLTDDTTHTTHSLRRHINDEFLYAGPAIGIKLSNKLSIGATLFAIRRSYSLTNTMSLNRSAEHLMSLSTANLFINHTALALLTGLRYSAIKTPARELNLSLTVRTRSFGVFGDASLAWNAVDENEAFFDGSCDESFQDSEGICSEFRDIEVSLSSEKFPNFRANTISPWEVTTGIAYIKHKKWTFAFDMIHHFGQDYSLAQIGEFTFGNIHQRTYTPNASLGLEYYFSKTASVRMGGYTNLSANTDKIVETIQNQDRLDLYGINVGLGFETDNSSSHFGVGYSWGSGKSSRSFGEDSTSIQLRTLRESNMNLLIAGSYYFD